MRCLQCWPEGQDQPNVQENRKCELCGGIGVALDLRVPEDLRRIEEIAETELKSLQFTDEELEHLDLDEPPHGF